MHVIISKDLVAYDPRWSQTWCIDPWTSNIHGEVGLRSLVSTFCLFSQLVCRLNNLRLVWPAKPFVIYTPSVLMDLYYGLNLLPCFSLLANAVMLFLPRVQCYMDFEYMFFSTSYFCIHVSYSHTLTYLLLYNNFVLLKHNKTNEYLLPTNLKNRYLSANLNSKYPFCICI